MEFKSKKSQILFYTILIGLLICSSLIFTSRTSFALPKTKFGEPENLGSKVSSVAITHASYGKEDGREVMYTTVAAKPGNFQVIDLIDQEVIRSLPLEGSTSAATHLTLPDGTVYIGGHGILYEYSPITKEVKEVGKTTGESSIYALSHDEEGNVYFGTYPNAKAYKYDPKTEELHDYGRMSPDQNYARSTGYYDGHLYVGIGTEGSVTKLDVETGDIERIDLPTYDGKLELAHAYSINVVENYIIVWIGVSGDNDGLVFYDADKGDWSDTYFTGNKGVFVAPGSVESGTDGKVFYNKGLQLMEINLETMEEKETGIKLEQSLRAPTWIEMPDGDLPGYSLATVMYGGQVSYSNLETKVTKVVDYPIVGEPTQIQTMEKGLDGRLYMSAYPGGIGAIYSIEEDNHEVINPLGQAEGMTALGDKFYYGVYPKARIFELDITDPLSDSNPKQIFDIPGQDRPFIMKAYEDQIFIGTIPPNGSLGGALTVYDPDSNQAPKIYENVIHNQSIVGLEFYNGKLYGSTTVAGGLDMTPTEAAAKVFVWDIEQEKVIEEQIPNIPGATVQPTMISGLSLGPDGLLWAAADGSIFAMDPETLEIVKHKNIYPKVKNAGRWRPVHLRWGEDDLLYTTLAGQLTVIDIETLTHETLAPTSLMTLGDDGNIYYIDDSHLHLMEVEVLEKDEDEKDPEPEPDPVQIFLDIFNNNFEEESNDGDIPGWTIDHLDENTSIEISNDHAQSGKNSLHLLDQTTTGTARIVSDLIEIEPEQEYTVGASVLLEGAVENPSGGEYGSNQAVLQVRYYDENEELLDDYAYLGIIMDGTRGVWTEDSFEFTPHEKVKYVRVWITNQNNRVSDAYFDDVFLYKEVDPMITEVSELETIYVEYGTVLEDVALPSTVDVTIINGETMELDIDWDGGDPTYDANTSGTYRFTGTLKTNINNPENLVTTIKVVVAEEIKDPEEPEEPETIIIEAVEDLADITVDFGTTLESLDLPKQVQVTMNDDDPIAVNITWDLENAKYNGNQAGTYTFEGVLDTEISELKDLTISVNVIVAPQEQPEEPDESDDDDKKEEQDDSDKKGDENDDPKISDPNHDLTNDKETGDEVKGDSDKKGEDGKVLPSTATNIFKMLGIGILLFVVGLGLVFIRKKSRKVS